jgi:hypothetical protein
VTVSALRLSDLATRGPHRYGWEPIGSGAFSALRHLPAKVCSQTDLPTFALARPPF